MGHYRSIHPFGIDGVALLAIAFTGTHGKTEGTVLGNFSFTEDADDLALVLSLAQIAMRREDTFRTYHVDDIQPLVFHLHLEVEGSHATILLQDVREVYCHLHLLLAVTVTSPCLGYRGFGIRTELGYKGFLGTVLEGERLHSRLRPGQYPVLIHRLVVHKLSALKGDTVVVNAHHHSLPPVGAVHVRHLVGWFQGTVIVVRVLTGWHGIQVTQRGCSDAGERVLPKVPVIVEG